MANSATQYLIGLGGWDHEVFDTCLYPRPGMSSQEKLAYYSRFFGVVEVRPTFWDDTITADDAKEWLAAVAGAGTFLFVVKLHARFTHKKQFNAEATRNIRGILQLLEQHGRLGALLMQFPYAFTNTSTNRFHLARLAEIFRGFPVHVELRHDSWHQTSANGFLAENGLAPVSADLPRIRQFMPFSAAVTGDTAYLRLHGRNDKGWLLNGFDARYDYLYNARELQELKRRLEALDQRARRVMVICNNTTGGKAIVNALQLVHAVRGERVLRAPSAAYRTFPMLRDFTVPSPVELPLFGTDDYREAM